MLRLFKRTGRMFNAVVIFKRSEDDLFEFKYEVLNFQTKWCDEGYILDKSSYEYHKMIWKEDFAILN